MEGERKRLWLLLPVQVSLWGGGGGQRGVEQERRDSEHPSFVCRSSWGAEGGSKKGEREREGVIHQLLPLIAGQLGGRGREQEGEREK